MVGSLANAAATIQASANSAQALMYSADRSFAGSQLVAAERLMELCKNLLSGNDAASLFNEGPCSKAERITNDWFHE